MMAPKFKELAKEYQGRVKFVKVDVQRDYVGVQVRSMPTFHFYLQGKLENQFSGADENGMRQYTQQLDRKAEAMEVEISLGALEKFYNEVDPSKLLQVLKKNYGKVPEYTKKNTRRKAAEPAKEE